MQKCPVCKQKLVEWYRKERSIKSLSGLLDIISHVYRCENEQCNNYRVGVKPEEESLLAIKGYKFGLDVIIKIGQLRFSCNNTHAEIQKSLQSLYSIKISEREVGYLERAHLALTQIVAKEDPGLLKDLENLKGMILSIDGIKPDASSEVLYLIREVQSGRVLAAKMINEDLIKNLEKMFEEVIDLGYPILGVVSDKEQAIVTAIENKLGKVPHQLCQYHYLKNVALPLIEADGKLKKKSHST